MRFQLALYDAAYHAGGGSYWTWKHPELAEDLLDRFYYDFARLCSADEANVAHDNNIEEGCARIDENYFCWYQWLNGGHDLRGRPGRRVLLCAFSSEPSDLGLDYSAVMETATFQQLAALAHTCPVSAPAFLELEIEGHLVQRNDEEVSNLERQLVLDLHSLCAIRDAAAIYAWLPPSHQWHCQIWRRSDGKHAKITLVTKSRTIVDDTPSHHNQQPSHVEMRQEKTPVMPGCQKTSNVSSKIFSVLLLTALLVVISLLLLLLLLKVERHRPSPVTKNDSAVSKHDTANPNRNPELAHSSKRTTISEPTSTSRDNADTISSLSWWSTSVIAPIFCIGGLVGFVFGFLVGAWGNSVFGVVVRKLFTHNS